MKCSNEISCQRNYNYYLFKGIFLSGFVFLGDLDKPDEIEKYLVVRVLFCPS